MDSSQLSISFLATESSLSFSSRSLETGQLVRHHCALSQLPTLYFIGQRLRGLCPGYQVSLLPSAVPRSASPKVRAASFTVSVLSSVTTNDIPQNSPFSPWSRCHGWCHQVFRRPGSPSEPAASCPGSLLPEGSGSLTLRDPKRWNHLFLCEAEKTNKQTKSYKTAIANKHHSWQCDQVWCCNKTSLSHNWIKKMENTDKESLPEH